MTGGGSLLYGLDKLIAERTHINTIIADDAVSCVALGTGKFIEFEEGIKRARGKRARRSDDEPQNMQPVQKEKKDKKEKKENKKSVFKANR